MSPKSEFKDLGVKNSGNIPVKGGIKYYFGDYFYGAGELGAVFSTKTGGGTAFAYAPTLGASFALSDKMAVDLGLRYEGWSNNGTSSFFGIRAALAFGL